MQEIKSKLTVYFDDPFWIGVYERVTDGNLEVCKITFGAQPKDYDIYHFFLQNWNKLCFSPPIKADNNRAKKMNPKRMQRAIKKQLIEQGIATKSQQALKLQQEESKRIHKKKIRRLKDDEKQRQFELRQQKRKEKHRGR